MFDRGILIALAALVLCLSGCNPAPDQINNLGHESYLSGDYAAALAAYERAQVRAPESGEPYYNAGNALYRMKKYEEALQGYDDALRYAKSDLRSSGFFNRGNAAFQTQQYAQAIEAYKEVLRMDPDDMDAKHNLELALRQFPPPGQAPPQDEQQQGQPPPQDQDPEQDQPPPRNQDPEQDPQAESVTEEQARLILESVGASAQTLQERRQQVLISPNPQSEFDW